MIEGIYPNASKNIYDKPTARLILNGENVKSFTQHPEPDKDAHSNHYYSVLEVLFRAIRQRKKKIKKYK